MTNDCVVIAQIAYDLQDAIEEISAILELIEPNKEIDEDEFNVRFAHLYWHLNSAWNVRNLSSDELEAADNKQSDLWGKFPADLKPL